MRRLLAPLTRWLDRRIDARIAAALAEHRRADLQVMTSLVRRMQPSRLIPGHVELVAETARDIQHVTDGERKRRDGLWMGD